MPKHSKQKKKYWWLIGLFGISMLAVSMFYYLKSDSFLSRAASTINSSIVSNVPIDPAIGTNLNGINYWSTQIPFIDAFKSAQPWLTQADRVWDTKEFDKLELDENGWVKSLPKPGAGARFDSVASLMFRDSETSYPGGQYIVLYEGDGTIEYTFDATKDPIASKPGRDVLNVIPSGRGILLKITATDPNGTGDYIRNIHIVPAEYEKTYQRQVFNPDFINRIKRFHSLRFMDWMATNDSEQAEWSDRPTLNTAYYMKRGVPVELMVDLANLTDTDPWFCMPHMATDEYVTNFARYVKEHLEPERRIYVEYSNEVWNGRFEQSRWSDRQGQARWRDRNVNDGLKKIMWFSQRTVQIMQIWDRVFGSDRDRVIGVMAGQSNNSWIAKKELEYLWADKPLSHQEYGIDAIGIAPYFGGYLGRRQHQGDLIDWTTEADGGLDKLFDEIVSGGMVSNSPPGGALQQSYEAIQAHIDMAKAGNLKLLAYEGGQHLAGTQGVENNKAIANLFIEANRDPRMGFIYQEYIQKWFGLGGDLFVNFNDIYRPDKWGSWGLLENVGQTSTPKYDAVLDLLEQSSRASQ